MLADNMTNFVADYSRKLFLRTEKREQSAVHKYERVRCCKCVDLRIIENGKLIFLGGTRGILQ